MQSTGRGRGGCECSYTHSAHNEASPDLEVLKWLRRPGKPKGQIDWGVRTCRAVAAEGHLHVLKWLRDLDKPKGQCEWGKDECLDLCGSDDVKQQWILTQSDEWVRGSISELLCKHS